MSVRDKSATSWFQTPGQSLTAIVARAVTNEDFRLQTIDGLTVAMYSDGRPMTVLIIPLLVTACPDFPDGRAAWYAGFADRESLALAMQGAGCEPKSLPEKDAVITVTFTGYRQIPSFPGAKKMKQVTYWRPGWEDCGYRLIAVPDPLLGQR